MKCIFLVFNFHVGSTFLTLWVQVIYTYFYMTPLFGLGDQAQKKLQKKIHKKMKNKTIKYCRETFRVRLASFLCCSRFCAEIRLCYVELVSQH